MGDDSRPGTRCLRPLCVALLGLAVLGGCASPTRVTEPSGSPPAPTVAALPSPGVTRGADGLVAVVNIVDGKAQPRPKRYPVRLGESVTLTFTSPEPDEVHVHRYDLLATLSPMTPATLRFTANLPGLVEVESHRSDRLLLQLMVE